MSAVLYTQEWKRYIGTACHMLRFYFMYPDITIDQMTPATQRAWIACSRAVSRLTDDELEVVRKHFHTPFDRSKSLSREQLPAPVVKTCRMVAIERGLADDR